MRNYSYIRYILIICILAVVVVCPACAKDLPTVQNIINEQQERTLEPLEIIISHNQNVNTPEDIAAHAMQSKLQELLGQLPREGRERWRDGRDRDGPLLGTVPALFRKGRQLLYPAQS